MTRTEIEEVRSRASANVIVVGLVAMLLATLYVGARLAEQGDPTWWIRIGERRAIEAELPDDVYLERGAGYDGQYYYRLAREPLSRSEAVDGIRFDRPAYRQQRWGYPAAAWLLSAGGQQTLVPWSMAAVNLLGVGVLAAALATIARDAGRSPWLGLAGALLPGVVTALSFDLAEVTEAALLAVALVLMRRHHYAWAAALLAYGTFTRETVLLLPIAILGSRLLAPAGPLARWRLASADGPPLWVGLVPVAAYVVNQVAVGLWWDSRSGGADQTADQLGTPLVPILRALTAAAIDDPKAALSISLILIVAVVGLLALRDVRAGRPHERLALVGAALLTSVLGPWDRAIVYLRYPTLLLLLSLVVVLDSREEATRPRPEVVVAGSIALLGLLACAVFGTIPNDAFEVARPGP